MKKQILKSSQKVKDFLKDFDLSKPKDAIIISLVIVSTVGLSSVSLVGFRYASRSYELEKEKSNLEYRIEKQKDRISDLQQEIDNLEDQKATEETDEEDSAENEIPEKSESLESEEDIYDYYSQQGEEIRFKKKSTADGVAYSSDYLNVTIPADWELSAKYESPDERFEDAKGFIPIMIFTNSDGDIVVFEHVAVFGVTAVYPFEFGDSEANPEAFRLIYSDIDELESILEQLESHLPGVKCSVKEEAGYCDATGLQYHQYDDKRLLILEDDSIIVVEKAFEGGGWVYNDGVPWTFNEGDFYHSGFVGEWTVDELETLTDSLDTMEIKKPVE
jgi:cell division protein FtsL